ncbi:peptide-methionine (S)-S-oxide reductase MsrA [Flavobacterium ovatum]|uniref:peptide-methionine (S)-S-oxide reductase MsrA n=1 Tax=Flavobacterium ovatum TaxID=1928857 RepID=UPI00344BE453
MLKWLDIIKYANYGNPASDNKIEKSEEEWKLVLTNEEFVITRQKGNERAFSSESYNLISAEKYACICCQTLLFNSNEKFKSTTGWPSFTQPLNKNAVAFHKDGSAIEVVCNSCEAHLGYVFPDGPPPSGLRFCINAIALKKIDSEERKCTFGGGCFWCTEALFQQLKGIIKIESGYSGGRISNPTYREVCSGTTGHAEVIEISYLPNEISFSDLVRIHLTSHNPTRPQLEEKEWGTQYRSILFYRNQIEKDAVNDMIKEIQIAYDNPIVTEVVPFEYFYKAEERHQNYYNRNPNGGYCKSIIDPKLKKFKTLYQSKLR